MNQLERLEQSYVVEPAPFFEIGDTVRVKVRVIEAKASGKKKTQEEEKERIQVFEGLVIAESTGKTPKLYRSQNLLWRGGRTNFSCTFPEHCWH